MKAKPARQSELVLDKQRLENKKGSRLEMEFNYNTQLPAFDILFDKNDPALSAYFCDDIKSEVSFRGVIDIYGSAHNRLSISVSRSTHTHLRLLG